MHCVGLQCKTDVEPSGCYDLGLFTEFMSVSKIRVLIIARRELFFQSWFFLGK